MEHFLPRPRNALFTCDRGSPFCPSLAPDRYRYRWQRQAPPSRPSFPYLQGRRLRKCLNSGSPFQRIADKIGGLSKSLSPLWPWIGSNHTDLEQAGYLAGRATGSVGRSARASFVSNTASVLHRPESGRGKVRCGAQRITIMSAP